MNRQEEHFAAASKIAAVRQQRAKQRGVKLGYGQHVWSGSAIRLVSEALPIGTDDFSIEYYGNTYGSGTSSYGTLFNAAQPNIYQEGCFTVYSGLAGRNGVVWVLFAGSADEGVNLNYLPADPQERFHLIVTRSGKTVKVYINGALHTAKEQSEVKNFPTFQLALANSSDAVFARVYDYALSAEEVAALWNGGDPAGYVLPDTYKGDGNLYESDFSTSSEQWVALNNSILTYDEINHVVELDSGGDKIAKMYSPTVCDTKKAHVYDIEVVIDKNTAVTRCMFFPYSSYGHTFLTIENNDDITVLKGVYVPTDNYPFSYNLYCYFNLSTPTTVRIRSIRVTPIGCQAEYLPQNIMPAAQGDAAGAWLYSAAQKPFDGAYLPPLLETAGGADMTAAGTPEILYKTTE